MGCSCSVFFCGLGIICTRSRESYSWHPTPLLVFGDHWTRRQLECGCQETNMATLPGTTVPEGGDPASLETSLVTAGDGAQPGILPTGEADLGVTPGSGLESTGGRVPPAPARPAVPPEEATPGRTAFESARSRRFPPVGSTPELPEIPPGVFTPGPTHGSWVYTPLPVGAGSARGTAVTGSTGLPEISTPGTGQAFPPLTSYGAGSSKTGNRSSRRRRHCRRRSSTSEPSSSIPYSHPAQAGRV